MAIGRGQKLSWTLILNPRGNRPPTHARKIAERRDKQVKHVLFCTRLNRAGIAANDGVAPDLPCFFFQRLDSMPEGEDLELAWVIVRDNSNHLERLFDLVFRSKDQDFGVLGQWSIV